MIEQELENMFSITWVIKITWRNFLKLQIPVSISHRSSSEVPLSLFILTTSSGLRKQSNNVGIRLWWCYPPRSIYSVAAMYWGLGLGASTHNDCQVSCPWGTQSTAGNRVDKCLQFNVVSAMTTYQESTKTELRKRRVLLVLGGETLTWFLKDDGKGKAFNKVGAGNEPKKMNRHLQLQDLLHLSMETGIYLNE